MRVFVRLVCAGFVRLVCAVGLCGGFVRLVCAVSLCGESSWAIIYVEHLLGESHFSFVRCLCGVCAEPLCATGLCFVLRQKISCTNTLHKHPAQTPGTNIGTNTCTNTRHKHQHKRIFFIAFYNFYLII